MLRLLSRHFRKPEGLLGKYIAKKMMKMNDHAYHAIDREAKIKDEMNIFEIGYGPGYGFNFFLNKYDVTYHGIDYSKMMYDNAKKVIGKMFPNNRGELYYGDFLEYNHRGDSMDLVLFSNVTYFWKDLYTPFKNIHSILKDSGKLVFYMTDKKLLETRAHTNNRHFNHHDKARVKEILSECGFIGIKETLVNPENRHRIIIAATKK